MIAGSLQYANEIESYNDSLWLWPIFTDLPDKDRTLSLCLYPCLSVKHDMMCFD